MVFISRFVKRIKYICNCVFKWFSPTLSISIKLAPPKTVPYVDLNKYSGKWYEIASIPQSYSEGNVGTTATFGKPNDNKVAITIQYYENNFKGPIKERNGKGKIVDKKTNAKLDVQFVWPFSSDFWILDLGANYDYSAIGDPDRSALWILSRSSTMTDDVYNGIVSRMNAQQYDTSKLEKTPQK